MYEELVTDPLIDVDDIVVEVFNGDVSLDGTVPSQASARRRPRRQRVAGVGGVLSIANQIEVQDGG